MTPRADQKSTGSRPGALALLLSAALVVLLLVGWGLGALATSVAQSADISAVRDLASDRAQLLTAGAKALSFLGSGFAIFPLGLACCAGLSWGGRSTAALALAVSTIGGVVIANVDKLVVDRPRPPLRHLEHVVSPSFPSGHATQASAFYVALLIVFLARRPARGAARIAILGTATLVLAIAFSRVYLVVHYPSDVVAGLLLGTTWSLFASSVILRNAM